MRQAQLVELLNFVVRERLDRAIADRGRVLRDVRRDGGFDSTQMSLNRISGYDLNRSGTAEVLHAAGQSMPPVDFNHVASLS